MEEKTIPYRIFSVLYILDTRLHHAEPVVPHGTALLACWPADLPQLCKGTRTQYTHLVSAVAQVTVDTKIFVSSFSSRGFSSLPFTII